MSAEGVFKDTLRVGDGLAAGLSGREVPARFPCPKCNHETKRHNQPGYRICSNRECREVTQGEAIEERDIPIEVPTIALTRGVQRVPPKFPCPEPGCGAETKRHHQADRRICSKRTCRNVVMVSHYEV